MPEKVYSIFIGEHALDKDKELLNPRNRTEGIPPDETLISCKYTMEMNAAGLCTFMMPPNHPYISEIKPMITEVAVAEVDNIVWFGRVTDTKTDFQNCLEVHCEGAYAYLNDSVQMCESYYNLSPAEYLAKLIANHNAQVADNRKLELAWAKEDSRKLTGKLKYESTMECIQRFLDDYGGYIYCIMSQTTGRGALYWIDSRNLASTQEVAFGENLLSLVKTVNYTDICTTILPLGADVELIVPDLDENGNRLYENEDGEQSTVYDESHPNPSLKIIEVPLNLGMIQDNTVEPDENGIVPIRFIQARHDVSTLVINGPNVGTYGKIVRSVTFNEAYDTATLRQKETELIASQSLGGVTIDISAADLRLLDSEKGAFYLGMAVPVKSAPHGVDETLIITRIEADIVKVTKKITLGTLQEKTLSDIAGRGQNNYEVGVKLKKIDSTMKIDAKDSAILFIPA